MCRPGLCSEEADRIARDVLQDLEKIPRHPKGHAGQQRSGGP